MWSIPFLFFLPGFFFLRTFTKQKSVALFLLSVLFSIPFTSVTAFLLAEFHHFSLMNIVMANILLCAILFRIRIRANPGFDSLFDRNLCLVTIFIAIIFFFYYRPPFEHYFGGRDPGVYVINGIRIAKTGSVQAVDPLPAQLDSRYRPLFFESQQPVRYMGFLLDESTGKRTIPNFFYLYPVWFAIFYSLFGVHGMLYATPFFACAFLVVLALFARRMIGSFEWMAPPLILGASAVYLWFARFPNSEFVSSFFIFTAILCFDIYRKHELFVTGLMGALCLGLAFWARVDAGLMAPSLALFFAARYMNGTLSRRDAVLFALYSLLLLAGFFFSFSLGANKYIPKVFSNLGFSPGKVAVLLSVLCLGGIAAAYWIRCKRLFDNPWVKRIVTAILVLLLAYSYLIRPYYPASNIGSPNAEAFVALGWYFTHPIVLLALVGLVLYAWRFAEIEWILFSATLFYSGLYFYRISAHTEHFWMLRRYLPVICPAVALFATYAAKQILNRVPGHLRGGVLLLSIGLAGFLFYQNRPLHQHQEFRGSFQFIQSIAARFSNNDLLIINPRGTSDLHVIGPLLSYHFDKNVLVLLNPAPDLSLLSELISRWNGNVYYAGSGGADLASDRFALDPLEQIRFETPEYSKVYDQRPHAVMLKYFEIGWYRFRSGPPANSNYVDLGGLDDGNITNFHLKESYGPVNYRWTNGNGHVYFPTSTRRITSIILQLNPGPWVPGMERAHARIRANGALLVDLTLRNGYNTYEVAVPPPIQDSLTGVPIDIAIESRIWVPQRLLFIPDSRRVGVIVDWVKLIR